MTTPLQRPLARVQTAHRELPSLETMSADLLKLETDNQQPPLVRMLAGCQRTLTDYMRLMLQVQKKHAGELDAKFQGLVAEIQALVAEEPAPELPEQVEPAAPPIEPPVPSIPQADPAPTVGPQAAAVAPKAAKRSARGGGQ